MNDWPLIVGAGPVGLAAALLLARRGQRVRLIDRRSEPSTQSKALAVNPRTLELLEDTGVTAQMLQLGEPIVGARLYVDGRLAGEVDLSNIRSRYPFMLGLSQATTERLLAEAAARLGVEIERRVELVDCRMGERVEAELMREDGGQREAIECPWLLAADGAHSAVREALQLDFAGSSFDRPWSLTDLPLVTNLSPVHANLFLVEDGFVFVLRVYSGDESDQTRPVWRVMGNMDDPLSRVPLAAAGGDAVWESSFHISHRIVDRLQVGRVFLAGDAAHLHSPAGARGMNLGIEDAWVFAALHRRGELDRYHDLRHGVDQRTVRRVEMLTRVMRGESPWSRLARRFVPLGMRSEAVQRVMLRVVAGLDHAVTPAAD